MGTTTLLVLEKLLNEAISDDLEFDTTTNITTDTSVVSTELNQFDDGEDDFFNDWWLYITEGNNITVERKISNYATSGGTLTVFGANLLSESGAVTCRLHRLRRTNKKNAINRAMEQVYPSLHSKLDDLTLITGNILPNAHFEDWASATFPDKYTVTNATASQDTTAANFRGGVSSAKVTSTSANGYMSIHSDNYKRLLDLAGLSVTIKCWAKPDTDDDAAIVIYTKKADGTEQTLTSDTSNPSGEFTLLELENQALNDDLVEVEIRFKVITNGNVVYFDDARLLNKLISEYLIPADFVSGQLAQVFIQTSGISSDIVDDIHPASFRQVEFRIKSDGTDEYLHLDELHSTALRMRLRGYKPFTSYTADSDTIPIDGNKVNLIVFYAAYLLYEQEMNIAASNDISRYERLAFYWLRRYEKLRPQLAMSTPSQSIWTGSRYGE